MMDLGFQIWGFFLVLLKPSSLLGHGGVLPPFTAWSSVLDVLFQRGQREIIVFATPLVPRSLRPFP